MNIRKYIQDQSLRSLAAYAKMEDDVLENEIVSELTYMITDDIRNKKPEIFTTKEALNNADLIRLLFPIEDFRRDINICDPILNPMYYMSNVVWYIVKELLMTSATYRRLNDAGVYVDITNENLTIIRAEVKEAIDTGKTYFDLVLSKPEEGDTQTDETV